MKREPKTLAFSMQSGNGYKTKDGASYATEQKVNGSNALAIPSFYSGVRFLAETLSNLPKYVFQKDGESRKQIDHYSDTFISEYPNGLQNAIYMWETVIAHAVMYGNGYIWIERQGNKITGLYNLHSLLVAPFRINGVQKYKLSYLDEKNQKQTKELNYQDVIHLRGFSEDGEKGISVIDTLADSLSLPKRVDDFLVSYFDNGAAVNIAVETVPGLEDADIEQLRKGIKTNHVGSDNAHNVMVLCGATAKNLTSPLKDFALDVLKQSSVDDIARVLRIPPHTLYSLAQSNYNSLEWLGTELVKFSLLPWVSKIELEMRQKLLTTDERAKGIYYKWNLEGLQRGDYKTRAEVGVMQYTNNLITKNEYRIREDLPPDPEDGDKYFRMLNMALSGEPTQAVATDSTDVAAVQVEQPTQAVAVPTAAPVAPLNGAQISAAVEVVVQLRAGVLTAEAALALLVAVGLPEVDANKMVNSTVAAGPLQTVTDSTPQQPKVEDAPAETVATDSNQSEDKPTIKGSYGKFIEDAVNRVRTKQIKAFSNASKKTEEEQAEWLTHFSETQSAYLADALNPLLETIVSDPGLLAVLVQTIVERYAIKLKEEGEKAEPLEIVNEIIERLENGKN
jgi:HK97 family phage portal protein